MSWYDTFNPFNGQKGIGDPGGLFVTTPDQPQIQGGYYNQNGINQTIQNGLTSANVAAPQIDPSQQAQFRAMQMQQAQQLQRIASGQQQGAGELAAQRQVQQAIASQQGMAHMARGGQNAALAFRGAADNAAGIGLQGAGQAQQAALSDQQAAQGQLAGSLNTGRQGDMALAQGNANLRQQQYGINNQAQLGYLGQMTNMGRDQLALQTNQYNTNAASDAATKGGLISAAGTVIAAASDENLKTDISDAGNDIDDMLNNLVAKTYRYKDEKKFGAGPRAGIMAQDLQKSKAGSALVLDLPGGEGLGFDVSKAVSAALASTARLNERIKKLEGQRG